MRFLLGLAGVLLASGPAAAQRLPSASGATFSVNGVVQTDFRLYPGDRADLGTDAFLLRRARHEADVRIGRFHALAEPDIVEPEPELNDGWVEVDLGRGLLVRAGRMKTPVGLESLRSSSSLRFAERGLPTALTPCRDLGVIAERTWVDDRVTAALGAFNGVTGGDSESGEASDAKDIAARVFVRPTGLFDGLGLGLAGSLGAERGTTDDPRAPVVETPGGRMVFEVREGAVADGARRLAPQADFVRGPPGLLAEWSLAQQEARTPDGVPVTLDQQAWQVQAVVSLTGEPQSRSRLRPQRSVDAGGPGAFELAARVHALTVDAADVPALSDPATRAGRVFAWGVAAHRTPVEDVRMSVSLDHSDLATASGADLPDETFVVVRAQVVF